MAFEEYRNHHPSRPANRPDGFDSGAAAPRPFDRQVSVDARRHQGDACRSEGPLPQQEDALKGVLARKPSRDRTQVSPDLILANLASDEAAILTARRPAEATTLARFDDAAIGSLPHEGKPLTMGRSKSD